MAIFYLREECGGWFWVVPSGSLARPNKAGEKTKVHLAALLCLERLCNFLLADASSGYPFI